MTYHSMVQHINTLILTACLIGSALAYYAYTVETYKEVDESYEPLCDISEHVSCTKAFMSKYGKGFGLIPEDSDFHVPNSVYGILFYTLVAILSFFNRQPYTGILVVLGFFANLTSVYLAIVLYLLSDICLVCVTTYIVNLSIVVLAIKKVQTCSAELARKKKKTT
ncbi:vitamin K epoxide reductase complex subunit 1 [Belonocnema kinseyi]|uniref:vitamin K epoxide reductase complex subunit 1 n=1 Tax=Belonocnema kinseyi TaxID=2817044 RepID=UPI00143D4D74|nr:vitamin K epoxide reductase complex subunit 1 [Belonocnema kinseyi]